MNFFLNKFKRFSKIHFTTFIQEKQHLYNNNNIYTTTTTFIQPKQHLYINSNIYTTTTTTFIQQKF